MRYRVLGRTGLRVSELGVGGHEYRRWLPGRRDVKEFMRTQPGRSRLIERALEAGVNYFDTTYIEEVESLGLALKEIGPSREDVHVSIMLFKPFNLMAENPASKWSKLIISDVEKRLSLLNADYADVLTIYSPESNFSHERLEAMLETFNLLKEDGKVRYLGASSHNLQFLAELMRRYNCFDVVMVRYNYHLQEARKVIFPVAKALRVGVVVMKPFSWPYYGIPFMRFGPVEGEEGDYTPAQTCLRWILSSPEVATVVPGMNSLDEFEENLAAITEEGEFDEEVLKRYLEVALGPKGRDKLKEMLNDPDMDIRYYAERALST